MDNEEEKIEKLLKKFYDVSIEQDEIDYLCHYFLHTAKVPTKWQADAAILQYIGIERYCRKHRAEFENILKSMPQTKKNQKPHRTIWANYTYSTVAAVGGLILTVIATIQMMIAMPKNTIEYSGQQVAKANIYPASLVAQLDQWGVFCNDGCSTVDAVWEVYKSMDDMKRIA